MGRGQRIVMHCNEPWRSSSWHCPAPHQPPAFRTCGQHQASGWVLSKSYSYYICIKRQTVACQLAPYSPVRGGDSVVDRQLEGADLIQATCSHVGEEKPVSHAELWQQAALHNMVQLVQWWTPQTAGIHCTLSTEHMLERKQQSEMLPIAFLLVKTFCQLITSLLYSTVKLYCCIWNKR